MIFLGGGLFVLLFRLAVRTLALGLQLSLKKLIFGSVKNRGNHRAFNRERGGMLYHFRYFLLDFIWAFDLQNFLHTPGDGTMSRQRQTIIKRAYFSEQRLLDFLRFSNLVMMLAKRRRMRNLNLSNWKMNI